VQQRGVVIVATADPALRLPANEKALDPALLAIDDAVAGGV
jgi:hypothetical protein